MEETNMAPLTSDEFESVVYDMAKEAVQDGKLTRAIVVFEFINHDGKLKYGMLHPNYMSNAESLDMIEEAMMDFFPGSLDNDDDF